jgi:hypothetical protein
VFLKYPWYSKNVRCQLFGLVGTQDRAA